MSNQGGRRQGGLSFPTPPVHAFPLLPCPSEDDDPPGAHRACFSLAVPVPEDFVHAEQVTLQGRAIRTQLPAPDDPLAPATGMLNGVLLGLLAWALLGVVAASVYLAVHPH
jgi:hypothetical protein